MATHTVLPLDKAVRKRLFWTSLKKKTSFPTYHSGDTISYGLLERVFMIARLLKTDKSISEMLCIQPCSVVRFQWLTGVSISTASRIVWARWPRPLDLWHRHKFRSCWGWQKLHIRTMRKLGKIGKNDYHILLVICMSVCCTGRIFCSEGRLSICVGVQRYWSNDRIRASCFGEWCLCTIFQIPSLSLQLLPKSCLSTLS